MGDVARSAFSASIALLAGYSFVRLCYFRRFTAESLRADRYALHVLGYSFALFVLGELAAQFIPYWTPERFLSIEADLEKLGITAPFLNALLLGPALALLDNGRVRWLMRRDKSLRLLREDRALSGPRRFFRGIRLAAVARFVRRSNDAGLRAIFRAVLLQKNLMVTLKNNKVYVGKPYVSMTDDPTQALTFIKLLPLKSGYRDPTSKKVIFSTRYDHLAERLAELDGEKARKDRTDPLENDLVGLTNQLDELIAPIDIEDLGVVIAWLQVESLTIYDENLYRAFQALPTNEVGPISRV
jgi:hypothetical protein